MVVLHWRPIRGWSVNALFFTWSYAFIFLSLDGVRLSAGFWCFGTHLISLFWLRDYMNLQCSIAIIYIYFFYWISSFFFCFCFAKGQLDVSNLLSCHIYIYIPTYHICRKVFLFLCLWVGYSCFAFFIGDSWRKVSTGEYRVTYRVWSVNLNLLITHWGRLTLAPPAGDGWVCILFLVQGGGKPITGA